MTTDAFVAWLHRTFGRVHQPQGGSRDEWVIDCPKCGAVQRCYVNPVKRLTNCMRCGGQRLIPWLQQVTSLSGDEIFRLLHDEPSLLDFDAVAGRLVNPVAEQRNSDSENLPEIVQDFIGLGVDPHVDARCMAYLTTRGFGLDYLRPYGFCYAWKGRYAGRLIVPVWEGGRIIYFQARALFGEEPKYLNPAIPKGQVVFGYELALPWMVTDWPTKRLYVCEGAFNAMSLGHNAVALFGKTMSSVQEARVLQLLTAAFPNRAELIIAYDHGAESLAIGAATRFGSTAARIGYLQMPDSRDLNAHFCAGTLDVESWLRWL